MNNITYWKKDDLSKINYDVCVNNNSLDSIVLDLKDSTLIECIVIFNCSNIDKLNLYYKINNDWILLDKNIFSIKDNKIELTYAEKIETRFLKFTCLENIKVDIYRRKYKGLVLANRTDGFGGRMFAIINAMYIAEKTDFKFGFIWKEHLLNSDFMDLDNEEQIFSSNFLLDYSYTNNAIIKKNIFDNYTPNNIQLKNIDYIINEDYGFDVTVWNELYNAISDIDQNDFVVSAKKYWKNMKFSKRYLDIINYSNEIKNNIGNFIILHMRGGEVVNDIYIRQFNICSLYIYIFPLELILNYINNNNIKIILFCNDNTFFELVEKNLHRSTNIIFLNDLYRKDFSKAECDFFSLNLMSKADIIYGPHSQFKNFACLISENKIIKKTINDLFSLEKQYNIIKENIEKIETNNLYKASSYGYLYLLSCWLNYNNHIKMGYLKKAYELDNDNLSYKIKYIDLLMSEYNLQEAEDELEIIFEKQKDKYVNLLLGCFYKQEFFDEFQNYKINAGPIYPNISYVASKIYFYQKDINNAILYCKYSLENNFNKENFDYLLNLIDNINTQIYDYKSDIEFFKKQNLELILQIKYGTAKARIQNQLSYKLGQAMIENSKSILGYIRMPYVLSYIKDKHKQEQKIYEEKIKKDSFLKLPPLESYTDYKEALKLKEHLSYKLGEALIRAYKNWYKGGYIKLWFEIRKIRKEFKNK
ncbi:hypothetical protein [Campylobacter jejuni]|uniref:hypothetical protein n=1 Tax=Campylobacter jejuni TaxID=197 RepID=UPI0020441D16|nr:hypothetical protein [Campylobacter jejuni]